MERQAPRFADVYVAIADPTRRAILDRLRSGEQTVSALAEPFPMSRPAVSQHLRVLRDAGLVSERRVGRERRYRLEPARLRDVREWVAGFDAFWRERLDALGRFLDEHEDQGEHEHRGGSREGSD